MAPTRLPCPYTSCTYSTVESELAEGLEMLKMHERTVHAPPTHPPASIIQVKPEKVLRPQLQVKDGYVPEESFEYFVHSWNEYKELANVGNASKQLLAKCLGDEVPAMLYGKYGFEGYWALNEKTLSDAARMMVLKSRNKLVMQLQLQRMMQGAGKLDMRVILDRESYQCLSPPCRVTPSSRRTTTTSGTADTGATICCTGVEILPKLGILKSDLLRTRVDLYVADKRKMTILGVIPIIITVGDNVSGKVMQTRELLYVVKELQCTFVSKDALEA